MDVPLLLLCLGIALIAGGASFGMSFVSRRLAQQMGAIDQPTGGRKIHRIPTPLFGGIGLFVVGLVGMGGLLQLGLLEPALTTRQMVGFGIGAAILCLVGIMDDKYVLSSRTQFLWYVLACACVVVSGTSVQLVTNPTGGVFSLVTHRWEFWSGLLSFAWPADILTLGWLLVLLFSTKLMDGLDGLVTGQASIGAAIILLLCVLPAYHLPAVALLSSVMLGGYLGFLPVNLHPAKQFLGEAGSTLAGFTLGFLAIASGAKLATALMALGVALIDIGLVILGRLRRRAPLTKGDRTHLHHQLLDAGFSQRKAVGILWSIGLMFGIAALVLQTRGKILLFICLIAVTIGLSIYATKHTKPSS